MVLITKRFLYHRQSVIAVFNYGTALAEWLTRAAQGATVAYEVDVEGVELSLWDNAVQYLVRALVRAFLRDESDASEHAKDMRVQRKDLFATGEEQRAGDCLRAYAAKLL